jgi:hypothetical protein
MTTLTTSEPIRPESIEPRVAHPLERLRNTIRRYIALEGFLSAGLYLSICFWLGLAADYGAFKTFGIDWVQELPRGFRAVLLGLFAAGLAIIVFSKTVLRYWRAFRPSALALLLERRFPGELGERLITAVELADPRKSESYGYSRVMIDRTIREAADCVDRLPLKEVFDWRRLYTKGAVLGVFAFGLYLLAGAAYLAYWRASPREYAAGFNGVAGIWFERNILLRDTIWPRRAYLELIGFPEKGELKIGRDASPPTLRVRALKWVVEDHRTPEGWRALRWADLSSHRLGFKHVPGLPADWQQYTVDQVELALDKPETQTTLDADALLGFRNFLSRLDERASAPGMARILRKLEIPKAVTVYYQGATVKSEQTLKRQADYLYSGVLSDLRESVHFTARGEDYYTPYKYITLVPPPGLAALTVNQEVPAYLYHRPPAGGNAADLKGKKQIFRDVAVSLSGSTSRIDVPAGTSVLLKGKADKPLDAARGVVLRAQEGQSGITAPVTRIDEFSFEIRFDRLMTPLDFFFDLTDTDGVTGMRHMVIKPTEDLPPELDVQVEVMRKTNEGYLVTPVAHVPFSGKVRDDHGLDRIEYVYTLQQLDSQSAVLAGPIVSGFQFTPRGIGGDLLGPAYLAWLGKLTQTFSNQSTRGPESVPLATFERRLKEKAADDVPSAEFLARLTRKPVRELPRDRPLNTQEEFLDHALLREHTLDPDEEFFDVEKLGLKVTDERQIQPRHRMRLSVDAVDNNIETGPGKTPNRDRFVFLIVSENELLSEIAKEEESLHLKLEETVNKLKDARAKLEQIRRDLPTLARNEYSPIALRAEEIADVQVKGWDVSREIYVDYRRIGKELRANRVTPKMIERVEQIADALDGAINQEFPRSDESMRACHDQLEERRKAQGPLTPPDRAKDAESMRVAKAQMDALIDRLNKILDAMGDITTLNKLIAQLAEIEKQEHQAHQKFKEAYDRLQDTLLQGLGEPSKPPVKK